MLGLCFKRFVLVLSHRSDFLQNGEFKFCEFLNSLQKLFFEIFSQNQINNHFTFRLDPAV